MAYIVWGPQDRWRTPVRPILVLGAVVAALLFGLLVWPTRWWLVSSSGRVYRVDRFTGCYQYATDTGWSRPWQRTC